MKLVCTLCFLLAACGGPATFRGLSLQDTDTDTDPGSDTDTDGPNDTDNPAGAKRVFLTSAQYAGDLGGVDGGDAHCQSAADTAGLNGSFHAWLSTSSVDAIDRIQGSGPWVSTSGAAVFASRAELGTQPTGDLRLDESGAQQSRDIWTGTAMGGRAGSNHCLDWTSASSSERAVSGRPVLVAEWTDFGQKFCDTEQALLCFEQ